MSPTPKELRYPGPLTLGDHSAGVRRVQEWLTLADCQRAERILGGDRG